MTNYYELREKAIELSNNDDIDSAIKLLEEAYESAKKENQRMACVILGELALLLSKKGLLIKAFNRNEEALELALKHNFEYSQAALYTNMGLILQQQGMPDTAASYFEKSLSICHNNILLNIEASTLLYYGKLLISIKNHRKAIDLLIKSLSIFHENGNKDKEIYTVSLLKSIYESEEDSANTKLSDPSGEGPGLYW